jgi:glyoxylate reductase
MRKVYITRQLPERGLKKIKEKFDVEIWSEYGPPPKQVIKENIMDADALVSLLSDEIDEDVFDAAPKLHIVAQMAVGFDNINIKEATKRGIYITNTPGVLTETTADFAWALLMAVTRRVVEADKYIRDGEWKIGWHPSMLLGKDVYGATIGIIGAGRIGSAVARRAKGFNMKILYYSRSAKPDLEEEVNAKRVNLNTLLREADFVSIHVSLSKETYHLIDAEKIKLMKKTAYLINTSRGAILDEKALYKALKEKRIAGAALDVFEKEPLHLSNPLLELKNVIIAPHISSASYETRSKMADMVANNLLSYFKKIKPPNLVNPEVLQIRPL